MAHRKKHFRVCLVCGAEMERVYSNKMYCSNRCKARGQRRRRQQLAEASTT